MLCVTDLPEEVSGWDELSLSGWVPSWPALSAPLLLSLSSRASLASRGGVRETASVNQRPSRLRASSHSAAASLVSESTLRLLACSGTYSSSHSLRNCEEGRESTSCVMSIQQTATFSFQTKLSSCDILYQYATVEHCIDCFDFKHKQRIEKTRRYSFLINFCFLAMLFFTSVFFNLF